MIIKQLSIFVENKPGRLAEITELLGRTEVDIRALSIADTRDFGILRLIVNRPEAAVAALEKAGLTVNLTDVIAVGIDDTPGAFAKVIRIISDNSLDLEYMYAFISRQNGRAFVIMRIQDIHRAIDLLRTREIQLLPPNEVYDM